jgi:hypothetical protein
VKVGRGDELVMITEKGKRLKCYYFGKDPDSGWIFVVFHKTRHMARVSPRWVKFVRRRSGEAASRRRDA